MDNIEKLLKLKILASVRLRLGADGPNDESQDSRINKMNNHQLVKHYTGWHLGDDSWWDDLKGKFDKLEELDKDD